MTICQVLMYAFGALAKIELRLFIYLIDLIFFFFKYYLKLYFLILDVKLLINHGDFFFNRKPIDTKINRHSLSHLPVLIKNYHISYIFICKTYTAILMNCFTYMYYLQNILDRIPCKNLH